MALCRSVFFDAKIMFIVAEGVPWTAAWWLAFTYTTRVVALSVITGYILDKARNEAREPEVHRSSIRIAHEMRALINVLESDSSGLHMENGERIVDLETFCKNFPKSRTYKHFATKLNVHEEDLPDVYQICDESGDGKLSVPEVLRIFTMFRDMLQNPNIVVSMRSSITKDQRVHALEKWVQYERMRTTN
jgi:hypothetical protein